MKITIFGSCRQVIGEEFIVSKIQEELTYPHYSKEIIQAIEFCKSISNIPENITRYIFRTGILKKKTLSSNDFLDDFNTTDLFIIEIASIICYKYKNYYAHHILESETNYTNDIQKYNLTDIEIEEDIIKIKNLLSPKKFIICSHIYTRTHGKRYELVQLLKKICLKYSIPFFDPIEELNGENLNLILNLNETVLAHFTSMGNDIIKKKYTEFINNLFMS